MCISTVGVRKDLFQRNPDEVPITDFFGSVRPVQLLTEYLPTGSKAILPPEVKQPALDTSRKYRYVPQLVNFDLLFAK